MRSRFLSADKRRARGKGRIGLWIFLLMAVALFANPALAIDLNVLGKPLAINGYINQGIAFGVAGDSYTTYQGFQQALLTGLLEMEYMPSDNWKIFITGQLVKDWAYDIYDGDDDWGNDQPPKDPVGRRFKESRDELSLYDDYEDVLKECHVTWTPQNLNIRVGKQIVVWGRMDGVQIMDRINPLDRRRGPSDVEFETSVIPIWLAKVEYFPTIKPKFLLDLGLEFVFNPNMDFIPNKNPSTGNNVYGIWAADTVASGIRIWSPIQDFEEPDRWDSEGFEYGFRIKGTLLDNTYFTLNYFNGVENSPIYRSVGISFTGLVDDEGHPILSPLQEGYYPDLEFAGFTLAHDLESLYIRSLGGVSPLIRLECLYEFNSTFTTDGLYPGPLDNFTTYDVVYGGIAVEWKFRWNLLNPRRYFALTPQFMVRHIRDYPENITKGGVTVDGKLREPGGPAAPENRYTGMVIFRTQYMHDKLEPMIYFQRDVRDGVKYDFWRFSVSYEPDETWKYSLMLVMLENDGYDQVGKDGDTYYHQGQSEKDYISFTVKYQF